MIRRNWYKMKLTNKYKDSKYEDFNEYFCDITDELDRLAGIERDDDYHSWRHYILADKLCVKEKCLAIRIPGGTVGDIWINDNGSVTKIRVVTNYVVGTYPKDVNEQIQKFIGEDLIFE